MSDNSDEYRRKNWDRLANEREKTRRERASAAGKKYLALQRGDVVEDRTEVAEPKGIGFFARLRASLFGRSRRSILVENLERDGKAPGEAAREAAKALGKPVKIFSKSRSGGSKRVYVPGR